MASRNHSKQYKKLKQRRCYRRQRLTMSDRYESWKKKRTNVRRNSNAEQPGNGKKENVKKKSNNERKRRNENNEKRKSNP